MEPTEPIPVSNSSGRKKGKKPAERSVSPSSSSTRGGGSKPSSRSSSPNRALPPSRPTSRPSSPTNSEERATRGPKARKRYFTRELRQMMFGFGDRINPLPQSVELMEELVLEYITQITNEAMSVATKKGRLQTEDVLFVIRKDRKKYGRVLSLLTMNEELKKARKAFELEADEKEIGKV